jgi:hypothetical protein
MPYYINHTDGTSLVTVQDGSVDNTTTSLSLVGKNFPTYGQLLNQNLVNLLENFSSSAAPENSLIGQLWYDNINKCLNFYREGSIGNYWQKLAVTTESDTPPVNPRLGDLWWDSSNSQLKLYDTTSFSWKIIGPQTTSDGKLRIIGTNNFYLQVGGNNALIVDTYGGLNLPYNPCFIGYDNIDNSQDATTADIESYNTWIPNYVTDRGTNFNLSTGIFTVRTPGVYQVYAQVTTLGGTNPELENEMRLRWYKNGSDIHVNAKNNHPSTYIMNLVCGGIIECISGDTIQLVYSTFEGAYISRTDSTYSIRLVG